VIPYSGEGHPRVIAKQGKGDRSLFPAFLGAPDCRSGLTAQCASRLAFVAAFVGHSQFLAPFRAAGGQYAAAVGGRHSLQKTVFVAAFALGGLECTFHLIVWFRAPEGDS